MNYKSYTYEWSKGSSKCPGSLCMGFTAVVNNAEKPANQRHDDNRHGAPFCTGEKWPSDRYIRIMMKFSSLVTFIHYVAYHSSGNHIWNSFDLQLSYKLIWFLRIKTCLQSNWN